MKNLSRELEQAINKIKIHPLKTLLLSHLNPHATEQLQLFTHQISARRQAPHKGRAIYRLPNSTSYQLVLNMVFAFAPIAVCEAITDALLGLDAKAFTKELAATKLGSDEQFNESVIQTLIHYAPTVIRIKLLRRISQLDEENIIKILWGKSCQQQNFQAFQLLLNAADEEVSLLLLKILASISPLRRHELLQTSSYPQRYDGLSYFFKSKPTELIALAALRILQDYQDENLQSLLGIDTNLCHLIFETQSEAVNQLFLHNLNRLKDESLKALLSRCRQESPHKTPLEIAFERRDTPTLAAMLVKMLSERPSLKPLLTQVSLNQYWSPMHRATFNNNSLAMIDFLKKVDADLEHKTFATSKTMRDLAASQHHEAIVTLIDAFPVYKAISDAPHVENPETQELPHYAQDEAGLFKDMEEIIRANPSVLISTWSQERTLLHYAVVKGQVAIMQLLVDKGANLFAKDSDNFTVLDLAIHQNQLNVLQKLIPIMLKKSAINLPLIAEALTKLTLKPLNIDSLTAALDLAQPFQQVLSRYTEQNNDAAIFFLVETAKAVLRINNPLLMKNIREFIKNQLQTLANNPSALLKNQLQLSLICFAFSLRPAYLETLIQDLLTEEECLALGLLLLRALVQKSVLSSLSTVEYTHYIKILASLSSPAHKLTQNLASFHFQHSNLTLLPAPVLQQLSDKMDTQALLIHVKQRRSPILLALVLEKLLAKDSDDKETTYTLLQALGKEIALFNKEDKTFQEEELLLTFNLITQPKIKDFLDSTLMTLGNDSFLFNRLQSLFAQFKTAQMLLPQSYLRELFFRFASTAHLLEDPCYHSAFEQILAVSSLEEIKNLARISVDTIQQRKQLYAAFSPILASPNTAFSFKLSAWLFTLLAPKHPLLDKSTFSSLQELRSKKLPEDKQILLNAAQLYHQQTEELTESFSCHALKGLFANPRSSQCLDEFLDCFFLSYSPKTEELLFTALSHSLRQDQPPSEALIKSLAQRAALVKNNQSILIDLQILGLSESLSLAQLAQTLYVLNEAVLLDFKQLCVQAQVEEFTIIIDYLLAAQKENIPVAELIFSSHSEPNPTILHWLEQLKNRLDHYCSRVVSLNTLIPGLNLTEPDLDTKLNRFITLLEENTAPLCKHALVEIIKSYENLLCMAPSLIQIVNSLLRKASWFRREEVLNALTASQINTILQVCLEGLHKEDPVHIEACKNLLSLICQSANQLSTQALQLIKVNLNQPDLDLLGCSQLIDVAQQILREPQPDLPNATINGVWIQRLLRSPQFVAAANPEVLKALLERYRLLSLTLKQDEYNTLNQWLNAKLAFAEQHAKNIAALEQETDEQASQIEKLRKKRNKILLFRADDSIRALLMELEDTCLVLQKDTPVIAGKALDVLYNYYNNCLSNLRSDLVFQLTDYLYARAARERGDIELAQNPVLKWLEHYLPHFNFEQKELVRKKNAWVYDEEGQQIGWVNESNQVMCFVNHEPCPMLDFTNNAERLFYDENRLLIGSLTRNGEFKRENLFQKQTASLLLAKVPAQNLEQSPAALELLFHDVLNENTLESLITQAETDKQPWIQQQIQNFLPSFPKKIAKENFQTLVKYQPVDSIFLLLETIKSPENVQQLFFALLRDEEKRAVLLSPEGQKSLHKFLLEHPVSDIVAACLKEHHQAAWFSAFFQSFADFSRVHKCPQLLSDVLFLLNKQCYEEKTLAEKDYNAILTNLIANEKIAAVVWQYFLDANLLTQIQGIKGSQARSLTGFFYKNHCLAVIEQLNNQRSWSNSYQYRLLLLILSKESEQLFVRNELRYSETIAWKGEELNQLCRFVRRHICQPNSPDKDNTIAKKLISELVFRCANFGDTSLFYHASNGFEEKMATANLERSYLDTIAAKSYLPSFIKTKLHMLGQKLKTWFSQPAPQEELSQELKNNQAIIDWQKIREITWELTDRTHLPLIAAYLINYSGNKEPLFKLINDYCQSKTVKQQPLLLQNLSRILLKFPERDISAALFNALEKHYCMQAKQLDYTVFCHLAVFYAKQQLPKNTSLIKAQVHLLKHFGQQQNYTLVKQCCKLLNKHSPYSEDELIKKIETEASVEQSLAKHLDRWYFGLLKFFKRLWNYGFEKPSKAVLFCDQQSYYKSPIAVADKIKTPILDGQTIAKQMAVTQKLRAFKARYDRFLTKEEPVFSIPSSDSPKSTTIKTFFKQPRATNELKAQGENPSLIVSC